MFGCGWDVALDQFAISSNVDRYEPSAQTDVVHRPPLRPAAVDLLGMSFGAAEGYVQRGGQRVIADDCAPTALRDIAAVGLDFPRDLGRGVRAVGAFVIGMGAIHIRARLAIDQAANCRGFVRARCGQQLRVAESSVDFQAGQAEVDLPLVGISTHVVQTIDELWTWECRLEGSDFAPIEVRYGGSVIDAFPIRLYFTASRPINVVPRESFYHVACAVSGATNPMQAERDVWAHFTAFRMGRFVTNARGQRLGFWRDRKPGVGQQDVITRNADDLIRCTDSSCRGWAELLREALAVHGINARVRAVQPKLSLVHPRLGLPMFHVPDGRGGRTLTRTVGILVKPFRWKPAEKLSPFPFTGEQAVVNPGAIFVEDRQSRRSVHGTLAAAGCGGSASRRPHRAGRRGNRPRPFWKSCSGARATSGRRSSVVRSELRNGAAHQSAGIRK
jgi:hypothetical protein